MKTPVLNEVHQRAGGRIGEFAGWMLPIHYGSAIRETEAVRNAAGLFDVSHMGRLEVIGEEALPALQKLFTNDLSKLNDGGGQYTLMCNPEGGVIDDLIAFRKKADHFYLVVNASNLDKDKAWIVKNLPEKVALVDRTPETALVALQGPNAIDILVKSGLTGATEVKRFHFLHGKLGDYDVLAMRTGYTGENGFEIACRKEDAEAVWNLLIDNGKDMGLIPCGLASRDVLRTEAGLPLYGHEMDEKTTPAEAGLMRWVKLDKGEFFGRDNISALVENGLPKKLAGIEMEGRDVPRPEDAVETSAGNGTVTSGTYSPSIGKGIAMAYVPPTVQDGEQVNVLVHGKPRPGMIKKLPLYSRKK
ncbi:MAG: glycine cleavage system aminomethyltransferase GcvT [Armatimonadota bacterium]